MRHKDDTVSRLTPITRMSISLVLLTISIMLSANWMGLTPDRNSAYLNARKIIAETVAVQVSKLAETGNMEIIHAVMNSIQNRNEEITALSLQLVDNSTPINVGDAQNMWDKSQSDVSTPVRLLVPIFSGDKQWGRIGIQFTPLGDEDFFGISINLFLLLLIFVGVSGFGMYYLFLKRALHYLDPASVIPERVKAAMDVLSEGVLILDKKGRIVLANRSFSKKTGTLQSSLLGKKPETLPWELTNTKNKNIKLPWVQVRESSEAQTAVAVNLVNSNNHTQKFMVNSSPIIDAKGNSQGVLTTFDDVTKIEKKNTLLSSALDRLKETQLEIKNKNKELSVLASQDSLTGCLNRRSFFEIMDNTFSDAEYSGATFSCIMLDIDFFKAVNDNYGHGVGDEVIKSVSRVLNESLRDGDSVCRYGGEEFCILLKNTSAANTIPFAERIRKDIELLTFSDKTETNDLKITVSLGISDSKNNAKDVSEIVNQADYALYGAKESGRNRVMLWGDMLSDKNEKQLIENNVTEKDSTHHISTDIQPITEHDILPQTNTDISDSENDLTSQRIFLQIIHDMLKQPINIDSINAILIIDIDDFKRINNALGYEIGDKIIQEKHRRLSVILRNTDILTTLNDSDDNSISRLNGDQFGALLHNLPSKERLESIVDRIIQSLAEPYIIGDHTIYATCSIGVSTFPKDGDTADTLYMHSESAMNCAKSKSGNNYHFYTQKDDSCFVDSLNLENDLRNSLSNNEMTIYFQPKLDISTNTICGMESLIRWRHPLRGLLLPNVFLPIAEKTGLIHELGIWVFRQACEQAASWEEQGFKDISIAVNISATQFPRGDFIDQIMASLESTKANPKMLEIEITENAMIQNIEIAQSTIQHMRNRGIKSSLDDFGTGYSSLHHIKQFPIDSLKIDISFISNILNNSDDVAIVSAIIGMAHAMGIKVIAEGVENNEQLMLLRELKCDQVQGYFISRPKPQEDASALLRAQTSAANEVSTHLTTDVSKAH